MGLLLQASSRTQMRMARSIGSGRLPRSLHGVGIDAVIHDRPRRATVVVHLPHTIGEFRTRRVEPLLERVEVAEPGHVVAGVVDRPGVRGGWRTALRCLDPACPCLAMLSSALDAAR